MIAGLYMCQKSGKALGIQGGWDRNVESQRNLSLGKSITFKYNDGFFEVTKLNLKSI